jgi:hypothetical protein
MEDISLVSRVGSSSAAELPTRDTRPSEALLGGLIGLGLFAEERFSVRQQ